MMEINLRKRNRAVWIPRPTSFLGNERLEGLIVDNGKNFMKKKSFRKPVLERYRSIWLTSEAHALLRKMKPRKKKSLAQLVQDAIVEMYAPKDIANP